MPEPLDNKKDNTGFRHVLNATKYSLQGLNAAFRYEAAFRQELALICMLLSSAAFFAQSAGYMIALTCACLLLLATELLNSGIEAAIDRMGTQYHEQSKLAKDYGSAAVMMLLVVVMILWLANVVPAFTSIDLSGALR